MCQEARVLNQVVQEIQQDQDDAGIYIPYGGRKYYISTLESSLYPEFDYIDTGDAPYSLLTFIRVNTIDHVWEVRYIEFEI